MPGKLIVDNGIEYFEYEIDADGYVEIECYGVLTVEEAIEKLSMDGYYCYVSEEYFEF